MKISEFDYNLPAELIATHPVEPRDAARMLLMDRVSGKLADKHFYDLADVLKAGDVLVFNDSKVIPARLSATINQQSAIKSRKFEVLLVKNIDGATWECWLKPGKKAKIGDKLTFSDKLTASLVRREDDIFILEFNLAGSEFFAEIAKIGEMPVPPYIVKARENSSSALSSSSVAKDPEILYSIQNDDRDDYQTVYAKREGSAAAPTAGLHFTEELLFKLREKGVQLEYVTLHVGLGTFQPVTTETVEDFQIHSEYYEISPETAKRLNAAKDGGRRVIAVGTTTIRVLESAAAQNEACGMQNPCQVDYKLLPKSGETSIYIYPGYTFRFVDGIITNFHTPKSSLLLLVSAFATTESIRAAYDYAVESKYRFYSYGDGMVVI
jgi:S-adenosylmethionine:tRNA ribosyltransferase-isomerase